MVGRRAAVGEAPRADRQGIDQHQRWPGAQVELVPIRDLIPDAKNARTHDAAQIELIASLMLSHGFTNPVLRDDQNKIMAGHGRVLGAALNVSRGHAEFEWVPCITARGWTDQQKRAYILADNQVALKSGWDAKLLGGELRSLAERGQDLASIGFSAGDLRPLSAIMGDAAQLPGMPQLPSGDKIPFVQITFTLHNSQAETLRAALEHAKNAGAFDEAVNANRNGNALARVVAAYLFHVKQ